MDRPGTAATALRAAASMTHGCRLGCTRSQRCGTGAAGSRQPRSPGAWPPAPRAAAQQAQQVQHRHSTGTTRAQRRSSGGTAGRHNTSRQVSTNAVYSIGGECIGKPAPARPAQPSLSPASQPSPSPVQAPPDSRQAGCAWAAPAAPARCCPPAAPGTPPEQPAQLPGLSLGCGRVMCAGTGTAQGRSAGTQTGRQGSARARQCKAGLG